MQPSISVVVPVLIPTLKHLAMTQECLARARGCTRLSFDLIVVESGSQYLADEADIYINEKKATTPEIGHNIGFRVASRKDFVILLTNDTFVVDNWLETLIATFDKKPDCGLATLGAERFGHVQQDRIEEGNWFDVCAIKREVFDQIGYYDERFIGSWPDTDFLVRAYKQGWKMYRNLNCILTAEINHATVYLNPKHGENYAMGQKIFRDKHEGCGLAIYEAYK